MAKMHGKNGVVKVGDNAVAEVTNWTLTITTGIANSDAMGDDWETHLTGKKAATGSITCRLDPSDTEGQGELEAGGSVDLKLYPSGDESGDREYALTATITSVAPSASHDDVVNVSFDFTANGTVTTGAVAA